MTDHDWGLDWEETYKSMIVIATDGFKFLALANGGAAVAILAYLGNVTKNGCSILDMSQAMGAFLVGLVLCGGAMVSAYELQRRRLNNVKDRKSPEGDPLLKLTLGLSVLSLVAFGCGSYLGVNAFQGVTPTALSSACPEQPRKVPDSPSPPPAPARAPADPGSAPPAVPRG